MRVGLTRASVGLVLVLVSLTACGPKASNGTTNGKLVAVVAGVPGKPAGPTELNGGDYEFRWSLTKPMPSDTLQLALYTANEIDGSPKLVYTTNVPTSAGASEGTYSTRLSPGNYFISLVVPSSWNVSVFERE